MSTTRRPQGNRPPRPDRALPFLGKPTLLSHAVGETLAERILRGDWSSGERIPSEPELARQLGVSRSVIRDAVRTLAARGLLDVRQGFGTIVRPPADDTYHDAMTVMLTRSDLTAGDLALAREALDLQIAELAAERHTPEDIEALERHHADLLAAAEERDW